MTTPKIYVACLAAYNNGLLHGRWIDADQSADAIHEEVKDMLACSPEPDAEEWAIHDSEGLGHIDEWEDFETVSKLGLLVKEHGELILEYRDVVTCDIDELEDSFLNNYYGAYDSVQDYAEQFLEDTGSLAEIPKHLRYYFDFSSYARDLELSGDIFSFRFGGETHVFCNH
jgi:antirestriction protein